MRPRLRWVGLGLAAVLVGSAWWGWVPADYSDLECRLDQNGAWLEVDWASRPVDEAAVEELAASAARRGIRYLYPFVTYLRADGTFNPTFGHAAAWVATVRQHSPEATLLAWIGIPLANEGLLGIEGHVRLSEPVERERIARLASQLVNEAGFDGVHLDVETVRSGDPDFLALLEEVKASIGDSTLSVAGSYWLPKAVNRLPVLDEFKWDGDYIRAVAGRVDQIVIMTYDSAMPLPALFRLWMREEVRGVGRSLAGTDTELLLGVSASREKTLTHRPGVEDMANGLAGVCAGIARYPEAGAAVSGLAVYAAWEAEAEDWGVWEAWRGTTGR